MKKIRINVVHMLGSLKTGGAEMLVFDSLSCSSCTSEILYTCIYRKKGELEEIFKTKQLTFFQLDKKFLFDFVYLLRLRKILKKQKNTIVHAHQPIDALFAWLACINTDIKIVLTFHGFDHKNTVLSAIIRMFIIKHTDMNIFVSRSQKNYYCSKYRLQDKKREKAVYNGIALDKFDHPSTDFIRDQLSISQDTLLLGSVGSFVSGRDQMTICRFLNLLNIQNVDFAYLFIGSKSSKEPWLFDDCVKYCKKHGLYGKVFFLGIRKDVPGILSQLDAYLYSSVHDAFGLSVIEAIAVGVPVFVNDWAIMKEITENGKDAIIYKTKNEQDLLDKFLLFLDNRDAYIENAKKSAERVRSKFSIENHLSKLKVIYESLLEAQ